MPDTTYKVESTTYSKSALPDTTYKVERTTCSKSALPDNTEEVERTTYSKSALPESPWQVSLPPSMSASFRDTLVFNRKENLYKIQCCGSDPHWFHCGSGFRSGSASRVLMTKNWNKNLKQKYFILFYLKTAINLSLGLNKGRLSYRRSLHPLKKNVQHFKT